MSSTSRLVRWCVGAMAVWAVCAVTAARAGESGDLDRHPEIRFAKGLQNLGYTEFAKEQLVRTREREYLPQNVRRYAARYLGQICKMAGDAAAAGGDLAKKHDEYKEGIEAYEEFLKGADPQKLEYHDVVLEESAMCSVLGNDAIGSMKGTSSKDEAAQYKADGKKWFDMCLKNLAVTSKFFKSYRDDMEKTLEGKTLTIQEKEVFFAARKKAGEVLMEFGKALLSSSELYKGGTAEENTIRNARLYLAIKTFEDIADYYSIFDVRYVATRYIAKCWRELGDLDKAIAALKISLSLQPTPDTVWIIRLARYELAQTYNAFAGHEEDAITAATALASELDLQIDADVSPEERQDLIDLRNAAMLEMYTAYVGKSKALVRKAQEEEKKGNKVLVAAYRMEAEKRYREVLQNTNDIAMDPSSKWSRNAQALLKQWSDESKIVFPPDGIPLPPGISTYMAEGRRLYNEGSYLDAIVAFQGAVMAGKGKEVVYSRTFLPEAWYLMGLCYYRLSTTAHTGGSYTYYYEAGECIARASDYSKWVSAADAAFYCQQLFGAQFEHARRQFEAKLLNEEGLRLEAARYVRSLEHMGTFGGDQRATEMVFQAAEMWRTLEQYEKASYLYSGVPQESKNYYQAKYLAGFCLYLEALKTYEAAIKSEDGKLDRAKEVPPEAKQKIDGFLLDTVALYDDYINWFDNNSERLGAKQSEAVNKWIAETKVAYGKMLIHDVWVKVRDKKDGAERALRILDKIQPKHMEGEERKELREKFLPDIFMINIQAYRRLDRLDDAEKFVEQLVVTYPKHTLTFHACSLLGYAYLQKRQELEEQKAPVDSIRDVSEKAARWLKEALDRAPETKLALYNDLGAQLYMLGEYERAVSIFKDGLMKFPAPRGGLLKEEEQFAFSWLEDAYLKLENWKGVEVCATRLLDHEKSTEGKGKNIDYRSDLATALEKQGRYDDAVEWWRAVKFIAEEIRPGTAPTGMDVEELKFTSVLHLALCYVGAKQAERGYQVLGWYMLSTPNWLQNPGWAKQAEEAINKHYAGKWPEVGGYILILVDGDLTLVRQPKTCELIRAMIKRHCPDKVLELEKKIKEASIQLETGK